MEFLTAIAAFMSKFFAAINFHALASAIGGFFILAFKLVVLELVVHGFFKLVKFFRKKFKKDKGNTDEH